uniref:Uncharacterized protein n=1 Tax=Plectus sambesii TaxID=2011161 RepID=A0A914VEI7_9BILA
MRHRFSHAPTEQRITLTDQMNSNTQRQRSVWPTQVGGFLVCVGFMVGVANMAFFPSAICSEGDAGNFVLVYLICIIFIGFPVTYLHLCLGQYSGCNPTGVFGKLCPLLKGIGWSWLLIMIPLLLFSNINTTWSIYYLYISADALIHSKPVPWQIGIAATPAPDIAAFHEAVRASVFYEMPASVNNSKPRQSKLVLESTSASYFHHLYHTPPPKLVIKVPVGGVEEMPVISKEIVLGNLEPSMVASLAVAWLLVFFCVFNGVHTMNNVVYVTATLPYVIMLTLLARAITLEDATKGIALLIPDISRLSEKAVWIKALKMTFFDLQISVGVLMSIASHNRFHTNVFRDALALVAIDVMTSLLAAGVAFSFLGYLAIKLGESDVRAMCRGQVGPHLLWDQIFRSLGYLSRDKAGRERRTRDVSWPSAINCTFTWCETLTSSLQNKFPLLRARPRTLTAIVCVAFFLLSLPCCFQGGVHIYNLLVTYSMKWNVMIVAILQFFAVSYVYGVENLFCDIRKMLRLPDGHDPSVIMRLFGPTSVYIRSVWTWITPTTIAILLACDVIMKTEEETIEFNRMPGDSNAWCLLSLIPLLPIPLMAIWELCLKKGEKQSYRSDEWNKIKIPNDEMFELEADACAQSADKDSNPKPDGSGSSEMSNDIICDYIALKLKEDRSGVELPGSMSCATSVWRGTPSLFAPTAESGYFELKALVGPRRPSTVVSKRLGDVSSVSSIRSSSPCESSFCLPPLQLMTPFSDNLTLQPLPASFGRWRANLLPTFHDGEFSQRSEMDQPAAEETEPLSVNLFKECRGDNVSEIDSYSSQGRSRCASSNDLDESLHDSIPSDPNESASLLLSCEVSATRADARRSGPRCIDRQRLFISVTERLPASGRLVFTSSSTNCKRQSQMPELRAIAFAPHIEARTNAMVEKWNSGDCDRFIEFYHCKVAELFDTDGRMFIRGEEEIIEYLNITFDYANDNGRPPIELHTEYMFDDGDCIVDIGRYSWHNMHNGSYRHKWAWMENDWYMVEDYFTIEEAFIPPFADDEDKEN